MRSVTQYRITDERETAVVVNKGELAMMMRWSRSGLSAVMTLPVAATALLLFAVPAANEVLAQARGPSRAAESARRAQDGGGAAQRTEAARMDHWLRRIAGKYDVEVAYRGATSVAGCSIWDSAGPGARCLAERTIQMPSRPASTGEGACRRIGSGAGVVCSFDADGAPIPRTPHVLLLGLDPALPGVRLLQIGVRTAHGVGTPVADTVTFRMECGVRQRCRQTNQFRVTPDGQRMEMAADQELVVSTATREPAGAPGDWIIEMKRMRGDPSKIDDLRGLDSPMLLASPDVTNQSVAQIAPDSDLGELASLGEQDDLYEVLVSGERRTRDPRVIIAWMQRLVGAFRYAGIVESNSADRNTRQEEVVGEGSCTPAGGEQAVLCEMRVATVRPSGSGGSADPGTKFNPAVVLFGFEPDELAIRSLFVDSEGIAEPALGLLVGDTLVSREPCAAISGTCSRQVRITADPHGAFVTMHIAVESDGVRTTAYHFRLEKLSQAH